MADWYILNPPNVGPRPTSASTSLDCKPMSVHRSFDGKFAEHLFEFRYIKDYFTAQFTVDNCTLLTHIWNSVLPNGQNVADALIQAIDQQENLVWVARELNRAKSYVANNDKPNANDPPLNNIINGINSLKPNSADALQVETLIRTFGALGDYYQRNAKQFQATGQRVMNILAQITPSTPIFPPLDTRFYNFMDATFSTYPTRISSRGTNMLNNYRTKLRSLATTAAPVPPPPDFAVYHDTTASIIATRVGAAGNQLNWKDLIPPRITHPECNTAGTPGSLILYNMTTGNPVTLSNNPHFIITALGRSQYGLTHAPTGDVYLDHHLADYYGPTCTGIRFIGLGAVGAGNLPTAKFDLDCLGGVGRTLSNLHDFLLISSIGTRRPPGRISLAVLVLLVRRSRKTTRKTDELCTVESLQAVQLKLGLGWERAMYDMRDTR
ncbi:hypothetical protein BDQ17DRAFT_1549868 [Cyathus striatus]|nr:hypothetical protein BDQ17DRAFT_1549868 [Cyathus striatus]